MQRLYDAHCHLHEFDSQAVESFVSRGIVVVAVSDDLRSSIRTLELGRVFRGSVIPCVGIHPWNIARLDHGGLEAVLELIRSSGAVCVGEVGLDRRFLPQNTFERQVEIFSAILREASSASSVVNIHSVGAWREALRLVRRADIPRAVFHWYTGPEDVLREIEDSGYMITINPSLKIQEKHRRIASAARLENVLLESDAPYEYKGIRLSPHMVLETAELLASLRKIPVDEVLETVERNFTRTFEKARALEDPASR